MSQYVFGEVPESTIIWDLDGTIIDSLGVLVETLESVLPKHGFEAPTAEVLSRHFHGTLRDTIDELIGGVTTEVMDAIMYDVLENQDQHYEVIDHHIFPDALELMKQFHEDGKRQIVVTNREHEGRLRASPRHIVANSDMGQYIDKVVSGDDSEHRKPKPEVLDGAMDSRAIRPGEILVIGDQLVDAELARNINARAVLVARTEPVPHLETVSDEELSHVAIVSSLADTKKAT